MTNIDIKVLSREASAHRKKPKAKIMACNFSVGVILPASGTGERMGLTPPKQFSEMFGKPLFFYSIYCFHRFDWVKSIILTVSEEHIAAVGKVVSDYNLSKVRVIEGGPTRHRSIYKGIQAFSGKSAPDIVIIHDAVRLFVTEELARNVAIAARQHGAAGVMRPLVSTVIAVESNLLEQSLDRSRYVASEMPQGFQFDVIKKAYQQSTDYDFDYGTECLLLAMKYSGVKPHILEGSADLWKVTYIQDLYAAEGMLKEHYIKVQLFGTDVYHPLISHLEQNLRSRRIQKASGSKTVDAILPGVNTFVFLHQSLAPDTGHQTKRAVQSATSKNNIPVLSPVIIHVFLGIEESTCDLRKYIQYMYSLSEAHKQDSVFVSGILAFKGSRLENLIPMVTEVIWERKQVFSGQLFIVRS